MARIERYEGPNEVNEGPGQCYAGVRGGSAVGGPGTRNRQSRDGTQPRQRGRGVLNPETALEVTGTHLFQKQKPGELMAEGVCLHPCRLF